MRYAGRKFVVYNKLKKRVVNKITPLLIITLNQAYFDMMRPAKILTRSINAPGMTIDFFITAT